VEEKKKMIMKTGRIWIVSLAAFLFSCARLSSPVFAADEALPQVPKFFLNDKPAVLTVQDLSGLGTRPLRLLVQRNNRARGDEMFQVYALGAREGEELGVALALPSPGVRATIYKILHEPGGARYLSMPLSVYCEEARETVYREKVGPFKEEFFIIVFEKTDSPHEKNVNERYFEERVRNLKIAAYKTNILFSSLKIKMKDFGSDQAGEFFERDAQVLVDRLIHPKRIFLVRIWKAAP
jgi:hypothetical protein